VRRAHANSCAFEEKPDLLFAANQVADAAATDHRGSLDDACGNCFRTVALPSLSNAKNARIGGTATSKTAVRRSGLPHSTRV
jgi:hypothetical protein